MAALRLLPLLLTLLIAGQAARYNLNPADEGYFLYQSYATQWGSLYTDIAEMRPPLSFWLTGLLMRGVRSIYLLRLAGALLMLLSAVAALRALGVTGAAAGWLLPLLLVNTFTLFPFIWYSWYALLFVALAWLLAERGRAAAAGLLVLLALLTKQNTGAFALAGLAVFTWLRHGWRPAANLVLACAAGLAAVLTVWWWCSPASLAGFIYSTCVFPFVVLQERLAANYWPFTLPPWPLLIAVAAAVLLCRRAPAARWRWAVLPLLAAPAFAPDLLRAAYNALPAWTLLLLAAQRTRAAAGVTVMALLAWYAGVFSGYDLGHSAMAVLPLLAVAAVFALRLPAAYRPLTVLLLAGYALTGAWYTVQSEGQRYAGLRGWSTQTAALPLPHCAGLLVGETQRSTCLAVNDFLAGHERFFCFPYDAFFYYLRDARNPTRYAFYLPDTYHGSSDPAVIADLEAAGVTGLVLQKGAADMYAENNPRLYIWLRTNFTTVARAGAYHLGKRTPAE